MYYLLYNPNSKMGSKLRKIKFVEKIYNIRGFDTELINILDVCDDYPEFFKRINENDVIVIIGGDGTLHRFANNIKDIKYNCRIKIFKGGTGNDFSREFSGNEIDVTNIIRDIPHFTLNGKDEKFLNCTGFGCDGDVCNIVNSFQVGRKGLNYYKSALSLFKHFRRYKIDVVVDGQEYHYDKVLFATVMNGKYFGGGMKLAPDSDRFDDQMELYIVHTIPFRKLIFCFPFIFLGKVMLFKKLGVECLRGKEFKLTANRPQTLQSDGDVTLQVKEFSCHR